jgi:anaerobic magnesium-protoporphyrin IX monomethyl ester cyclase
MQFSLTELGKAPEVATTPEESDDKHLNMLKAIAPYAKLTPQKNVTQVDMSYAIRKTKVMLVLLPQWAAEFPPFNLCRLSAVIKQAGYESKIIDANIKSYKYYKENIEPKGELNYKLWDPTTIWKWCGDNYMKELHPLIEPILYDCLNSIVEFKPTLVGFSVYQMNEEPTKWMIQKLKQIIPDIKIAVGGPNVQKGYFNKEAYYDYVVSGEGEEAILKILDEIENNVSHGELQHYNQPVEQRLDLNNFPMPDYDSIDFNEYKIPNGVTTELSRGCIAKCTFCEETHFWKYRQRMSTDILSEVDYLYHNKGTTVFWFIDSLVNGNLKELRAFAKGIIAKGISIKWTGYARSDGRMDLEYLQDLADSGCIMLNYGCESGSQKVLDDMDKGVSIAEMEQNFADGKKVGIKAATNWIVGFPTETYQDYADTLTFIWRNRDMNLNNISTGIGFGQGPETITGQNPDLFNLSHQKYLGHWITKDFTLGGPHVLMRVKLISMFLDQMIFETKVGYPVRPTLRKSHYTISLNDSKFYREISYEKFDYNIIKPNLNPFADSLVNEIWPFLRMLWRTRGGYTANIKFSPELDTAEFGTQHGTGKFTADYNFKINNEGEWTADFKFNFIQYWEHEPYKEEERQGPFFAQDFSRMTSNPALRARKLAKPEWGMDGRSGDDFMELMAEEQILNQTVNWSFNYDWKSTGNWGDVEQYAIAVPGNKPKIAEHPLVFRKKNEV